MVSRALNKHINNTWGGSYKEYVWHLAEVEKMPLQFTEGGMLTHEFNVSYLLLKHPPPSLT
jgi:hypothetical protein